MNDGFKSIDWPAASRASIRTLIHPAWLLSAATAIGLPALVSEISASALNSQFAVSRMALVVWTVLIAFVTIVTAAMKGGWTAAQSYEALGVRITPRQPSLKYGFRTEPPYESFEHATLKFGAQAEVVNDSAQRTDVEVALGSIAADGHAVPDELLQLASITMNATDWVGAPLERLALEPKQRARVAISIEAPVVEPGPDHIARLGRFVRSDVVATLRFSPVRALATVRQICIDMSKVQEGVSTFFANKLSHTSTNREDPTVLMHMRDEFMGHASESDRPA